MSTTADRVRELVQPIADDLGATVYDVEHTGGVLRVSLQRADGIDLGTITEATRRISAELDAADPLPERYTLEVSSPGLERPLRTPEHFAGAVGEGVKLKMRSGYAGDRRIQGELVAAQGAEITVKDSGEERVLLLADIERANTHVDWTPPPKPGAPRSGAKKGDRPKGKPAAKGDATPKGDPTPKGDKNRPASDDTVATPPEPPTPQSEATS